MRILHTAFSVLCNFGVLFLISTLALGAAWRVHSALAASPVNPLLHKRNQLTPQQNEIALRKNEIAPS